MSYQNLTALYAQADATDRQEGLLAYPRYRDLLSEIADRYDQPVHVVIAAFAA